MLVPHSGYMFPEQNNWQYDALICITKLIINHVLNDCELYKVQ